MALVKDVRTYARQVVGPTLAVSLFAYFAYHAIEGDRGILAWVKLTQEVESTQAELEKITHTREVLAHQTDLLRLRQGVVLCSPFTLFAVLGVIRKAVDCALIERASDEILVALGRFSDQWLRFSEHLDRLGKQLGTVQSTYDDLSGVRRRQLEKRLDEIDNLRTARGLTGADETPVLREVNAF